MKCNKCGKCCVDVMFLQEELNEAFIRFPHLKREFDDCVYYYMKIGKCPFLNDDKSCKIYDIRPLTCKAYPIITDNITITIGITDFCPQYLTLSNTDIKHNSNYLHILIQKTQQVTLNINPPPQLLFKVIQSIEKLNSTANIHNFITIDNFKKQRDKLESKTF